MKRKKTGIYCIRDLRGLYLSGTVMTLHAKIQCIFKADKRNVDYFYNESVLHDWLRRLRNHGYKVTFEEIEN
jgi:hypothetical protein